MPRVSAAFFGVGATCVLVGMLWGMQMGRTEDFLLAPAHAHLNLVGWVTMALYGTFYALTRDTMSVRLAWINFVVSTLSVVIMIPSLALFLSQGNNKQWLAGMIGGEILAVIGLLIFSLSVLRELLRKRD